MLKYTRLSSDFLNKIIYNSSSYPNTKPTFWSFIGPERLMANADLPSTLQNRVQLLILSQIWLEKAFSGISLRSKSE